MEVFRIYTSYKFYFPITRQLPFAERHEYLLSIFARYPPLKPPFDST